MAVIALVICGLIDFAGVKYLLNSVTEVYGKIVAVAVLNICILPVIFELIVHSFYLGFLLKKAENESDTDKSMRFYSIYIKHDEKVRRFFIVMFILFLLVLVLFCCVKYIDWASIPEFFTQLKKALG